MNSNRDEVLLGNLSEKNINFKLVKLIDEYFNNEILNDDFLLNVMFLIINCENKEFITDKTRKTLDCILLNIFNFKNVSRVENIKEVDMIFSIILSLGLQNCYSKIKDICEIAKRNDEYIIDFYNRNSYDISGYFENFYRKFDATSKK